MSVVYYDTETEILTLVDGTPYAVITRLLGTTTQRQIGGGYTRDVTETQEIAEWHNRIGATPK